MFRSVKIAWIIPEQDGKLKPEHPARPRNSSHRRTMSDTRLVQRNHCRKWRAKFSAWSDKSGHSESRASREARNAASFRCDASSGGKMTAITAICRDLYHQCLRNPRLPQQISNESLSRSPFLGIAGALSPKSCLSPRGWRCRVIPRYNHGTGMTVSDNHSAREAFHAMVAASRSSTSHRAPGMRQREGP